MLEIGGRSGLTKGCHASGGDGDDDDDCEVVPVLN
jgi:hypothetical protein